MLLAIDPGVVSPGVALFTGGQLIASARIKITKVDACLGERWRQASLEILRWVRQQRAPVAELVYEKPKVYPGDRAKGDPDDLFGLAAIGAGVATVLGAPVTTYEPREWCGQIKKVCPVCKGKSKKKCTTCLGSAWRTPRGHWIRSVLSAAEFACTEDQNDLIDAVGLGLKKLGRLEPRRVFSNGR